MAEPRKERQEEVLYIYDRICPKASKQREILREYGTDLKINRSAPRSDTRRGAQPSQSRKNTRGRNASVGRGQAGATDSTTEFRRSYAADRTYSNDRAARRSRGYSGVGGGGYSAAAVRERPLKLFIDSIMSFIDTVEERGINDERIAKRRAIAAKKWSEYKNFIRIAVILIIVATLFVTLAYNLLFKVSEITATGSELYLTEDIIAASGISMGDKLYSFDTQAVTEAIIFRCPYIKSVDVSRGIPNKVTLTLTEDSPAYYAYIWGDWLKLSAGLRVLDVTDEASAKGEGLTELILPEIMYSVAGGVLEFTEARHERMIRNVLSTVEASHLAQSGKIDRIDLSNEYDIRMEYDGRYVMEYGGEADMDLKLLMGYKTITNEKFESGVPAKIDLENVGEATVKYDHSLTTNSSK